MWDATVAIQGKKERGFSAPSTWAFFALCLASALREQTVRDSGKFGHSGSVTCCPDVLQPECTEQAEHHVSFSLLPFVCNQEDETSIGLEKLTPLRRPRSCWVLIYFCRGPVCRSGTCHLQNVPLDHLFLLILWVSESQRGEERCGLISCWVRSAWSSLSIQITLPNYPITITQLKWVFFVCVAELYFAIRGNKRFIQCWIISFRESLYWSQGKRISGDP